MIQGGDWAWQDLFLCSFPLNSFSIYSCLIQIFRRFLPALLQSPYGPVIHHSKQWVSIGFIHDLHDFFKLQIKKYPSAITSRNCRVLEMKDEWPFWSFISKYLSTFSLVLVTLLCTSSDSFWDVETRTKYYWIYECIRFSVVKMMLSLSILPDDAECFAGFYSCLRTQSRN